MADISPLKSFKSISAQHTADRICGDCGVGFGPRDTVYAQIPWEVGLTFCLLCRKKRIKMDKKFTLPTDLKRPLAFFDIETTGLVPNTDKIVELAICKVGAQGLGAPRHYIFNPEVPIRPEITKIHGISDADVKNEPKFREVARDVWDDLEGCDLAGFNIRHFDLPMLVSEFERAGWETGNLDNLRGRNIVDVQHIYHRNETRKLSDAVKFYLGHELEDAHTAMADTMATVEVFTQQVMRYNLPGPEELSRMSDEYEASSWFKPTVDEKDFIFQKGKHKGNKLSTIAITDVGYLRWMLFKAEHMPSSVTNIVHPVYKAIFRNRR